MQRVKDSKPIYYMCDTRGVLYRIDNDKEKIDFKNTYKLILERVKYKLSLCLELIKFENSIVLLIYAPDLIMKIIHTIDKEIEPLLLDTTFCKIISDVIELLRFASETNNTIIIEDDTFVIGYSKKCKHIYGFPTIIDLTNYNLLAVTNNKELNTDQISKIYNKVTYKYDKYFKTLSQINNLEVSKFVFVYDIDNDKMEFLINNVFYDDFYKALMRYLLLDEIFDNVDEFKNFLNLVRL